MIACPPLSSPAEFRAAFASVVSLEDLQALARVLLKRALEGNLTAAKMVLTYVMGKPNAKPEAPAPTPAPTPAERAAEVSSDPQRKEDVPPTRLLHARSTSAADDFARRQAGRRREGTGTFTTRGRSSKYRSSGPPPSQRSSGFVSLASTVVWAT